MGRHSITVWNIILPYFETIVNEYFPQFRGKAPVFLYPLPSQKAPGESRGEEKAARQNEKLVFVVLFWKC